MADKNYIKWGWREVITQYGSLFNIRINANQLNKLPQDDEWYVQITMMKIKKPKEHWYTHYFVENSRNKDKQKQKKEENLPF